LEAAEKSVDKMRKLRSFWLSTQVLAKIQSIDETPATPLAFRANRQKQIKKLDGAFDVRNLGAS
jgi:hypothetical protein